MFRLYEKRGAIGAAKVYELRDVNFGGALYQLSYPESERFPIGKIIFTDI